MRAVERDRERRDESRNSPSVGLRRTISSVMRAHGAIPASDRGQLLRIGLGAGEQVADASRRGRRWSRIVQRSGRSSGSSSSSQAIGAETGAPGGGPDGVRRDERLDRRVLGVVEPGPALARALRPTPTRRGRARSRRRPATRAPPSRWSRRRCSSGTIGIQTWMPRLPVVFGIAAHAEMARGPCGTAGRGRASPPRSSCSPGSMSMRAKVGCHGVGQAAGPGVDLEARLVAEPGQRRRRGRRSGGRSRRGPRAPSTPVSCQRRSQVGAVAGMSFCQKPGAPAPFGNRWRLSGRSREVRQHRRRDPGEVARSARAW